MTWYWSCNCCVWVEANKCAGNTADYRVFVHQDNLPTSGGTKIFRYGGVQYEYNNCWSINPNGPRVALPPGAHRVNPSTLYDNCTECEDDVDDPPSPGGGGGGGGGPGGGGPGGPGGGGPGGGGPGGGGEGETCGVKLQICPEHAGLWNGPDLYVPCSGKPDDVSYVRIYGYCFRVPGSGGGPEVDPIPDGAQFVSVGGSFDDCHDCAYGKKARLCPNQGDVPGIEDAPEIWVRSRDLPTSGGTIGFMWGNFCYELRASDPEEVVPIDAFILNPIEQFADCSECKLGIQAQPCLTEPDPAPGTGYEVWVQAEEAAAFTETVYFRYRELCYSLDPNATPSRIPFEAHTVVPKDEFIDCDTCICGERSEEGDRGIKAHLCPDQDIDAAEDVWALEEDIPSEVTYFKRGTGSGGTCYYVDPSDTPREIPVGSLIVRIDNTFENCFDCTTGGGSYPPPHDPPPFDPPPPWWPPPPEENYYQLQNCATGELGGWVRENHVCGVFNVVPCDIRGLVFRVVDDIGADDGCWEVLSDAQPEPPGQTWTHRLVELVSGCDDCKPCCACDGGGCRFSEDSYIEVSGFQDECTFFQSDDCSGNPVIHPSDYFEKSGQLNFVSCDDGYVVYSGEVTTTYSFKPSNSPCGTPGNNPMPSTATETIRYNCATQRWEQLTSNGWQEFCTGEGYDYPDGCWEHRCNGLEQISSGCLGDGVVWFNLTIKYEVKNNTGCEEPEVPA